LRTGTDPRLGAHVPGTDLGLDKNGAGTGTEPVPGGAGDPPERGGVLVPRSVIVLAGALAVAMAVTIGVLAAPMFRDAAGSGASPSPTPSVAEGKEKGRFATAPRACSLVGDAVAAELVPTLKITEVAAGECNWLASDWRAPSGAKYDLRLRITAYKRDGTEVTRAKEFFSGKKADMVSKVDISTATPKPSPPRDLTGLGDESLTFTDASTINLYGGSAKSTLVMRVSNLVAEIEYEHGGAKDDRDGRLAAGAEKAGRAVLEALKSHG
jgi:hypothetical protein